MPGEDEYKIFDSRGKFTKAVKNGRQVKNASWTQCRVLLSNKRLILAGKDGKKTLSLSSVSGLSGREDATQALASVANYIGLEIGNDVLVVSSNNHDEFRTGLFKAVLDESIVRVKHPAVEGGVVQSVSWEKARLSIDVDSLLFALKTGSLVDVEVGEVTDVVTDTRQIGGDERRVVQVSHIEDSTTVETHVTGVDRHVEFTRLFLKPGEEENEINTDLSAAEKEVLMALYSGVQSFNIPGFTGREVDEVEEILERLIELDIVDEIRERREVTLNSRGRNMASEAMAEE